MLEDPSIIISPESLVDPTSHPGQQDTPGMTPQCTDVIIQVTCAALVGIMIGIMSSVIFLFLRRRCKTRQNTAAHTDPTETPAAHENDDIATDETPDQPTSLVGHDQPNATYTSLRSPDAPATAYETLGGDAVASHVYHDIKPTPTPSRDVPVMYQQTQQSSTGAATAGGAYDKPRSKDAVYDDVVTLPIKKTM